MGRKDAQRARHVGTEGHWPGNRHFNHQKRAGPWHPPCESLGDKRLGHKKERLSLTLSAVPSARSMCQSQRTSSSFVFTLPAKFFIVLHCCWVVPWSPCICYIICVSIYSWTSTVLIYTPLIPRMNLEGSIHTCTRLEQHVTTLQPSLAVVVFTTHVDAQHRHARVHAARMRLYSFRIVSG